MFTLMTGSFIHCEIYSLIWHIIAICCPACLCFVLWTHLSLGVRTRCSAVAAILLRRTTFQNWQVPFAESWRVSAGLLSQEFKARCISKAWLKFVNPISCTVLSVFFPVSLLPRLVGWVSWEEYVLGENIYIFLKLLKCAKKCLHRDIHVLRCSCIYLS